ncbi:MAG: hypothetical protein NT151_12255 [Acidobacteria bacterium]|nr:hypothetical protein [Acidobacteriota bacterium]
MGRVGQTLGIAAIVIAVAVPALAQDKASVPARGAGPDGSEKTWNLVLTLRPDQARKAANDLVQMVKNPSGKTPPILSDLLGILSARIAVEDAGQQADKKSTNGPAANSMATSACVAALNAIGQQAEVVRNGYGALAAGLPEDKVADLRHQVQSLANQLVNATKSAIDQARKDPAPPAKR